MGSLLKHVIQFPDGQAHHSPLSGTTRDVAKKPIEKRINLLPYILRREWRCKEAYAAINVKSDPSGRNDTPLHVCRSDSSNCESVSLMGIGHCKRSSDKTPRLPDGGRKPDGTLRP